MPVLGAVLPGWRFAPRRLPTLLTLVLLPLLLGLGLWQLERAAFKEDLLEQLRMNRTTPELATLPAPLSAELHRYRRVVLSGYLDTRHSLFLDNRTYQRRVGVLVYSPLRLDDGRTLLVNRGWLAWSDRSRLPDTGLPGGRVRIHGLLDRPPAPGLQLGGQVPQSEWPRLVQQLDPAEVGTALNRALEPLVLLVEAGLNEPELVRDWQPRQLLGPTRHRAYAFQWFALALSLLVLFVVVNLHRSE